MPALTDVMIRSLRPPQRGRLEVRDSVVTGLIFRLTATDARSWSVLYRAQGQATRYTVGDYKTEDSSRDGFTIAQARHKAREVLRAAADGRDLQAEKVKARQEARREGSSFRDLAERWLREARSTKGERKGQAWRPKTRAEFQRLVRGEIIPVLGDMKPEAVTKGEIRALYDRIEARSASVAKHALAVLRMLYTWAAEEDHVDAVPLFPKRGQTTKRNRVLEEDELRKVWRALVAGIGKEPKAERVEPMAEAFKLMLLTAQRRGEVLSMRWADVTEEKDGAWWTVPAERHKGGREHRVPLAAAAVEALKRLHGTSGAEEHLFPAPRAGAKAPHVTNPQKAAERLWAACEVEGATLHDLRRTAATFMTRLQVPRLVVGKILGHADTDVTGTYDKHAYNREKRAALTKWSEELQRIVAKKRRAAAGKVLPWAL